jgi:DNA-binding NtrC family response regulator
VHAQEPATHQIALLVEDDQSSKKRCTSSWSPAAGRLRWCGTILRRSKGVRVHNFALIVTGERTSGAEDVALLRRMRRMHPHTRMIYRHG